MEKNKFELQFLNKNLEWEVFKAFETYEEARVNMKMQLRKSTDPWRIVETK